MGEKKVSLAYQYATSERNARVGTKKMVAATDALSLARKTAIPKTPNMTAKTTAMVKMPKWRLNPSQKV